MPLTSEDLVHTGKSFLLIERYDMALPYFRQAVAALKQPYVRATRPKDRHITRPGVQHASDDYTELLKEDGIRIEVAGQTVHRRTGELMKMKKSSGC